MLKIEEFSKLAQVPVAALRCYAQRGLIAPLAIDKRTGESRYSAAQVPLVNTIISLADLGYSEPEIEGLLLERCSAAQIEALLVGREAEMRRRRDAEQALLRRVRERVARMQQGESSEAHPVALKPAAAATVASMRALMPVRGAVTRLFGEIAAWANAAHAPIVGPPLACWHMSEHRDSEIDVEAALPVAPNTVGNGRIRVHTLPAAHALASTVHSGSAELHGAYQAVYQWAERNGYHIAGPAREVYLHPSPLRPDDSTPLSEYVTEVQVPVSR